MGDPVLAEHGAVLAVVFVDPVVAREARFDKAIVAAKPVRGDLGRRLHATFDDGLQRCFRTVLHDLAVHAPAAFEDAEDGHLARVSPALVAARAGGAEGALVDLDLAVEGQSACASSAMR